MQIKAETLILQGDPKDMICQAAEQMQVDLVVVGSRGLGKIKRCAPSNTSKFICIDGNHDHHSNIPVCLFCIYQNIKRNSRYGRTWKNNTETRHVMFISGPLSFLKNNSARLLEFLLVLSTLRQI